MTARARWISIIVCLLFANVVAMGFLVLASSSHPVDVHPDYQRTLSQP